MRAVSSILLAVCLIWWGGSADAQLPGLGGALKAPKIKIRRKKTLREKVSEVSKAVAELDKKLVKQKSRLVDWKSDMGLLQKRLEKLTELLKSTRVAIELERRALLKKDKTYQKALNEYEQRLKEWKRREAIRLRAPPPGPRSRPADVDGGSQDAGPDAGAAADSVDAGPSPSSLPVDSTKEPLGKPPEPPEPPHKWDRTDPELLKQLELTIGLINDAYWTLSSMVEMYRQQQDDVAHAHKVATRFLGRLDNPSPLVVPPRVTLQGILKHFSDLKVAEISLSLQKAKRAGLYEELARTAKETFKPPAELRELEPTPKQASRLFDKTRKQTLALQEDYKQLAEKLKQYRKQYKKFLAQGNKARLALLRIMIYEKDYNLTRLEAARQRFLDALHVTETQIRRSRQAYDRKLKQYKAEEAVLRARLRQLRLTQGQSELTAPTFSEERLNSLRINVIQHQLYLVTLRKKLEYFRVRSLQALHTLKRGETPTGKYLRKFKRLLDANAQRNARGELSRRREAWRREHSALQLEERLPGTEEVADKIVSQLRTILDIYDQIDVIKWEMEWIAQVARHYLTLYEEAHRGTWWYVWRIALSFLLLGAAFFLSWLVGKTLLRLVERKANPGPAKIGILRRYGAFLGYVVGVGAVWLALVYVVLAFIWGYPLSIAGAGTVLRKPLLVIGEKDVSILSILKLFGGLILTWIAARVVQGYLTRWVFTFFDWDQGIRHAVSVIVRYLVLFVGLALSLEVVGIGLGGIALLFGVIGIGIGFGLQNIASNFISGLILLFERPIKKGDWVEVGEVEGRIDEIKARSTQVTTRDNVSVLVPNNEFVTSRVVNWSFGSDLVRLHLRVGVAYGSDVPLTEKLLLEAARLHPAVRANPSPMVHFEEFGNSSLNFDLLFWTHDIANKYKILSDVHNTIDASFRRNGVTIPFPQRDVHFYPDASKETESE